MTIEEAITALDGHAILSEAAARVVCTTLGVTYPEHLVICWRSRQDAYQKSGVIVASDAPGSGLSGLELSYHACEALGIEPIGHLFSGKEYQARANRDVLFAHFKKENTSDGNH